MGGRAHPVRRGGRLADPPVPRQPCSPLAGPRSSGGPGRPGGGRGRSGDQEVRNGGRAGPPGGISDRPRRGMEGPGRALTTARRAHRGGGAGAVAGRSAVHRGPRRPPRRRALASAAFLLTTRTALSRSWRSRRRVIERCKVAASPRGTTDFHSTQSVSSDGCAPTTARRGQRGHSVAGPAGWGRTRCPQLLEGTDSAGRC